MATAPTDETPVHTDSMSASTSAHDERQKYDLTQKLVPFLDRHLIFPLLEFLSQEDMYPTKDLTQAKYDLMKPTNMMDYTAGLWKEIHDTDDVLQEFVDKREQVLAALHKLEGESQKVLSLLEDQEVIASLRQDKTQNLQYLKEHHGITLDDVNVLYQYAQCQYNSGNYGAAADLLYHFRILSTDANMNTGAAWGKFAAEILSGNWDGAMEELNNVKDIINDRTYPDPTIQLYHRTWLIHWSLFPFFNTPNGREQLCELFFSPTFINSIQTSSPWIIRYLTAAVVTSQLRKRNTNAYQKQVRDLIKIIKQETYQYTDPITEFVNALYVDFDFELAQRKLVQVETVLKSDFFLASLAEEFVECARHLISEAYCRIHQVIDIKDLSERLNLSPEDGEKWIVSLIRETRSDAKIDFVKGIVIMNHPQQSVYQQVIERTKGLYLDSTVMVQSIKTLQAHAASQKA